MGWPVVRDGLKGLRGERPSMETMPAMAACAALLQAAVALLNAQNYQASSFTLLSGIAALGLFLALLGDRVLLASVQGGFKLAQAGPEHRGAFRAKDKDLIRILSKNMDEKDPWVLLSRPAEWDDAMVEQGFGPRACERRARKTNYILLGAAVLAGLVFCVFGGGLNGGAAALTAVLCMGSPLSSTLIAGFASLRLQQTAAASGAVIPGWAAIEELGGVDTVQADADELFTPDSAMLEDIRIFKGGRIDRAILYSASVLSKCSHEVDSGFLSRSSWQLYLLEGVLYSASALIFQQNCDKIALFAIVDMVDDPRSLRQKRFLSAMIVVYLFCNMDAATSALHAVTLKQYLAFYSLHTRSVLQLVIESLSALEMILFILYMVLFISQQTSEKQEILNLNQQLQQANEQLRIYAEESAHTAQVQERNRLAREIHDTLGHVLTGITAGADACIQMMDDSPEMARHQMELIADTARNGMNDVRRSVKALRPDSLEKENLSGALNKMCTSMAQSSGTQIQLEESLAGLTLSQDEEDCVYRTVQEGITNAIRHGHATRVQVRCHIEDGVLEVSVRDNGIGCKSVTPGFGLQHMQERMLMLGGTFWYENSDGFCIRAEIPLRKTPGSEKRKQEETV